MKTIKNSKDITTLEVCDVVVFGNLEYTVCHMGGYFLRCSSSYDNDKIFTILNISKRDFVKNLGINTLPVEWDFPEVCSLEALTAIVSALFKEYEKQNELPKTWEEFCERNPIKEKEAFINSGSGIVSLNDFAYARKFRLCDGDKNICTSVQEAEAFLALIQLRQLRKAYVKDWEPTYKHQYYGIIFNIHGLDILPYALVHKSMSFPTHELAKQFLINFKDLLEIAKPLL
jgi:hypothetical protein